MKNIIILAVLLAIPFIPWKRVYEKMWERFAMMVPSSVEQFDVLLRKKWTIIQSYHLFLFSFILTSLVIFFFLLGSFLNISTIPLPVGISLGIALPFLVIYILKPNIEAGFLFECRLLYTILRTQLYAGATPQEALEVGSQAATVLQRDLEEVLLAWGGNVDPVLQGIAEKYVTDELNLLLSLIREMHQAGASNHKEVIQSLDNMKEMMEDEITAKEEMNDEKEMEFLEFGSFAFIFALFFLMVIPLVGDIVNYFGNL